jgi:hypothetical protein
MTIMTINERAAICGREAEQLGLKLVRNFEGDWLWDILDSSGYSDGPYTIEELELTLALLTRNMPWLGNVWQAPKSS